MSVLNTVLLIIHLFIALALVGVVLMQKSEGGALGIGGGGGGLLTGRGKANLLTRVTAALAAGFFATSLMLTVVGNRSSQKGSVIDSTLSAPAADKDKATGSAPAGTGAAPGGTGPAPAAPAPAGGGGGILDKLK